MKTFNIKSNLSETDELKKANIVPKKIKIEENGIIKESISFPFFKFTDIVNQNWENSDLKEQLETTKYMFFTLKKIMNIFLKIFYYGICQN